MIEVSDLVGVHARQHVGRRIGGRIKHRVTGRRADLSAFYDLVALADGFGCRNTHVVVGQIAKLLRLFAIFTFKPQTERHMYDVVLFVYRQPVLHAVAIGLKQELRVIHVIVDTSPI